MILLGINCGFGNSRLRHAADVGTRPERRLGRITRARKPPSSGVARCGPKPIRGTQGGNRRAARAPKLAEHEDLVFVTKYGAPVGERHRRQPGDERISQAARNAQASSARARLLRSAAHVRDDRRRFARSSGGQSHHGPRRRSRWRRRTASTSTTSGCGSCHPRSQVAVSETEGKIKFELPGVGSSHATGRVASGTTGARGWSSAESGAA